MKQLCQRTIWDSTDDDALDMVVNRANLLLASFLEDCPLILPGTVVPFAGATANAEWLFCDGAAVGRDTYPALFGAIGTQYGAGDGLNTFNVPDLRGRFVNGAGQGAGLKNYALGDKQGEEYHTLSVDELATHGHTDLGHLHTTGNSTLGFAFSPGELPILIPNPIPGITSTASANITNAGGNVAHENRPPYVTLNYLIKT